VVGVWGAEVELDCCWACPGFPFLGLDVESAMGEEPVGPGPPEGELIEESIERDSASVMNVCRNEGRIEGLMLV
jgi:hypothetical protein